MPSNLLAAAVAHAQGNQQEADQNMSLGCGLDWYSKGGHDW